MKIAVSTLFCLPNTFDEMLQLIPSLGTPLVELVDAGPHTLTPQRIARLNELKESYDLKYSIHAPFTDVNLSAHDPTIRKAILKRLESSIMSTSQLGEVFVFHPGNSTALAREIPGAAWRINMESILYLSKCAEEHGVNAQIENVPEPFPYVLKSVSDFERFFEEIGIDIGFVLDVAHSNLRGETLEFIRRFENFITHVHLSDNHGVFDEHLPIGEGSIDWQETISALKASRFDGWITIESYNGIRDSLVLLKTLI